MTELYNLNNDSEFESDTETNNSINSQNSFTSNSSDNSIQDDTISYTPKKENEIRDRALSLAGHMVYEYANIKKRISIAISEEIKLILNIIGKNNIKPCLEIENPNGGFGEVYVIYLVIMMIPEYGDINDDTLTELKSLKGKNEQLYQTVQQAINSMINTVIESNKYITEAQIFPEIETYSFFYHYNDIERIAIKLSRFDK